MSRESSSLNANTPSRAVPYHSISAWFRVMPSFRISLDGMGEDMSLENGATDSSVIENIEFRVL